MPRLNARSLIVTLVLDPDELAAIGGPAAPRVLLTIVVPEFGNVIADIASKSLCKAQAAIAEHGADKVVCVLQGKLASGGKIIEAGLVAQLKAPKPAKAVAWAMNQPRPIWPCWCASSVSYSPSLATMRDDQRVMMAILQRLDGTVAGLVNEARAMRSRHELIARRVDEMENSRA